MHDRSGSIATGTTLLVLLLAGAVARNSTEMNCPEIERVTAFDVAPGVNLDEPLEFVLESAAVGPSMIEFNSVSYQRQFHVRDANRKQQSDREYDRAWRDFRGKALPDEVAIDYCMAILRKERWLRRDARSRKPDGFLVFCSFVEDEVERRIMAIGRPAIPVLRKYAADSDYRLAHESIRELILKLRDNDSDGNQLAGSAGDQTARRR